MGSYYVHQFAIKYSTPFIGRIYMLFKTTALQRTALSHLFFIGIVIGIFKGVSRIHVNDDLELQRVCLWSTMCSKSAVSMTATNHELA